MGIWEFQRLNLVMEDSQMDLILEVLIFIDLILPISGVEVGELRGVLMAAVAVGSRPAGLCSQKSKREVVL